MITGKNYIGNQLSAKGGKTYHTFNPKLNIENADEFTEATSEEINDAVQLASEAFKTFRKVSGEKRAAFLNAIADEILALDQALISTYMAETGLPEGRAKGERGRTVFQLRTFADLVRNENWRENSIDLAVPDRQPLPKPDIRKTLIPLGPTVVFGASNFPLAYSTAGGDTASALAAGCPVVVKSHPMHAGTGELVASAIIKAAERTGIPNGVFSNINSSGIAVGMQLVAHPKVKAVGFTGSIKGGRALYDLAAKREEPIPVFAEMGSVNPIVITPNAIQKRAEALAETYAKSITLGTGQFCTNPGLILTIASENTQLFVQDLAQRTVAIEAQCMLHPNIQSNYLRLSDELSHQNGLEVVASYTSKLEPNHAPARVFTVKGTDFLKNPMMHQEVFGPSSLVVQCENEAELIAVINGLEGQLTGTIIAEENEFPNLGDLIDSLQDRVGRIVFNGVPTGVEVCESMTHGGPYPASTDARFTAVGIHAIKRWVRPFSYQSFPESLLPDQLK
jgi:NADP-dependent aldehyde dehydrogenase